MTLKKYLMSSGQSAQTAAAMCGYVSTVVAAGTTYANATLLTSDVNKISTAPASSGVRLDNCDAGDVYEITNDTLVDVNVYPATGCSFLTLATNVANVLPAGYTARCRKLAGTEFSFSVSPRVGSGGGGGSSGGAIPTSGLVLRYSAESLSSTLNNNDFVTTLAPDVGALTLTASVADRPTFKTGISPSGSDVIWFTGGDRLNVTGLSGLPSATQPGTIVCVVFGVQPIGASPSDYQHIVQYGSATALQARGVAVHRTSRWFTTSEVGLNLPAVSGNAGWGVRVLGHTYDGAVVSVLVDGEECASNVEVLNTGTDELAIGSAIGGAADYGAFYFMHLLIYNRVLTRAEWRSIMDYARTEWGA